MASKAKRLKKNAGNRKVDLDACVFCGRDDELKDLYGEKRRHNDITIHYFCALFSSGLGQSDQKDGSGLWGFVESEIKKEVLRANRLRCKFCGEYGASVGCVVKSCRVGFHFPCGVANGILSQYYGQFCCYCTEHRPRQVVTPAAVRLLRRSSASQPSCAICTCLIDSLIPTDDVLLMPCCQNGLLHRTCIQRQAVYSGLHFFKCPLCNDKDRFQSEMLIYGIYIPDQDAAWELENDAFRDLLERHCRCDVTNCQCPDGRDANNLDSCWEIMLCDYCGSQGTHLACSKLLTPMDDWVCEFCQVSSAAVDERRALSPEACVPASTKIQQAATAAHHQHNNSRPAATAEVEYRPRPRRLSRYIQMRGPPAGFITAATGTPRWLHMLLNDDLHTGRNVGAKLAYMCEEMSVPAGVERDDAEKAPQPDSAMKGVSSPAKTAETRSAGSGSDEKR